MGVNLACLRSLNRNRMTPYPDTIESSSIFDSARWVSRRVSLLCWTVRQMHAYFNTPRLPDSKSSHWPNAFIC